MSAVTNNDFPPEIARVIGSGLGARLAFGETFLDSFTEDAVLEFPFSPDPEARRIEGKAAALAFFGRANQEIALEDAVLDRTYDQVSPDTVILEYHAVSRDLRSGEGYPEQFITTVQLRECRISHLCEYFGPSPAGPAARNKESVRRAFRAWAEGSGSVFDLLAPDVVWTISGSGPSAGTFHGKQEFLDKAATPLAERLSAPVKPHVLELVADGDQVMIRFDGSATALDGHSYRNSFVWLFTMKDRRVVAATAFLDLRSHDEILQRVSPRPRGSETPAS